VKIIRVDMSKKTIQVEKVPEDYLGLGGRGMTDCLNIFIKNPSAAQYRGYDQR
jgi:hypothetical protein